MNKLPLQKRVQILSMLCEGASMRTISHIVAVSLNTVSKLLEEAGEAALEMHDEMTRGIKASRIQCDEIWSFNYCKEKNTKTTKAAPEGADDVWTWTALDSDSKLIVSYFVGDRSEQSAIALMDDLRSRLTNRVQLTTDSGKVYLQAVENEFDADVDYTMLAKLYGQGAADPETRYSPAECIDVRKEWIKGSTDTSHVSTSYVKRSNLSMGIRMSRVTRLTNAHSKKLANHIHMIALYIVYYNFIRSHKSLKITPAMAAGIATSSLGFEDVIAQINAKAVSVKRGPYKKNSN